MMMFTTISARALGRLSLQLLPLVSNKHPISLIYLLETLKLEG